MARRKKKTSFAVNLFWALMIALFIISFAVVFVLHFRPMYYMDIRLLKLEEVRSIAQVTEFYLTSALFRTDSRAGHYRSDHPEHSKDWLCWVELHNENGTPVPYRQPVPIDRYKFPIERYYADNFRFS